MTEVNWNIQGYDALRPVAQGNSYAQQIMEQAAKQKAGQQYAAGDLTGASNTVGSTGDFKTANELRGQGARLQAGQQYASGDYAGAGNTLASGAGDIAGAEGLAQKQIGIVQAQQAALQQVTPFLRKAIQNDPNSAQQAWSIAAQRLQAAGTRPEKIQELGQRFQTNPSGTLDELDALAQHKFTYEKGEGGQVYQLNEQGKLVQTLGENDTPPKVQNIINGPNEQSFQYNPKTKGFDIPLGAPGARWNPATQIRIEQAAADAKDSALSDEDAKFLGKQLASGDTSVLMNVGRGVQGAKNIASIRREAISSLRADGVSPEQAAAKVAEFTGLKAGERTLGTRGAAINLAADEAGTFAQQALAASAAVPRTGFVPLNRLLLMSENQITNPALKKLYVATQALINARARAISPNGIPRESDQAEGRKLLADADTPENYKAAVDQMMLEVSGAKAAPGNVRNEMRAGFAGGSPVAPQQPTQQPGVEQWVRGPNGKLQRAQ